MGTPSHSYGTSLAYMGSHSVTCHPTQVNAPRLTPAMQAGRLALDLPTPEGWRAELTLLTSLDSVPAGSRTSDISIMSPTPNHCHAQPVAEKLGMGGPENIPNYTQKMF